MRYVLLAWMVVAFGVAVVDFAFESYLVKQARPADK
jgi:hypothetical protein